MQGDFNSTPYLIMTLFGDSVLPRGGEIWLGSLVQLLKPLGINERLVRTSVFRLAKDTWLESHRIGRKSYYSPCHTEEIERNENRIYYQQREWDGNWRLLLANNQEGNTAKKDEFKKHLTKSGFSALSTNVWIHPTLPYTQINQMLDQNQLQSGFKLFRISAADGSAPVFEDLAQCNLRNAIQDIQQEYQDFIELYTPVFNGIKEVKSLSSEHCFLLKTLLINDYRYLLWHDVLNTNLLFGDDWIGRKARTMTAKIYRSIDTKANQHFSSVAVNSQGALPKPAPGAKKRFAHLL